MKKIDPSQIDIAALQRSIQTILARMIGLPTPDDLRNHKIAIVALAAITVAVAGGGLYWIFEKNNVIESQKEKLENEIRQKEELQRKIEDKIKELEKSGKNNGVEIEKLRAENSALQIQVERLQDELSKVNRDLGILQNDVGKLQSDFANHFIGSGQTGQTQRQLG